MLIAAGRIPQRWLSLSVAVRMLASVTGRVPIPGAAGGHGSVGSYGVGSSVVGVSGGTTIDFRRIGRALNSHRGGAERAASSVATPEITSPLTAEATPAILFDIDGVFKHGGQWEPKGAAVLHKIAAAGLPYAFMTNGGGGRTEEQYAAELSSKLNAAGAAEGAGAGVVSVAASNMVLSYSPWRQDLAALRDQPVLVVGDPAGPVLAAAKAFGWAKAMHISEYDAKHPLMNPFKHDNTAVQDDNAWDEGFAAVCVFTDPLNFFEALQVCSDVLLSSRPGITEVERGHAIPIFFSNPDLLWKTQHPFGRFGQGAFRAALEAVHRARLEALGVSQADADAAFADRWHQYGKPEVVQFRHAAAALDQQAAALGKRISDVYMVGDNPASDMQGAVNVNAHNANGSNRENGALGAHWHGALVKTGVYVDGPTNRAALVAEDVAAAVDAILTRHGLL